MTNNTSPLISICIANYNGIDILADCIDSILAQQGNLPFEIIIHDDASTDDSLHLISTRYPVKNYPNIKIIDSHSNVGFCIANNRMVDASQGEYILLLNNDAALAPDALISLLETANSQSTKGILTLAQYDWNTGQLVDRGCLLDPFYNPVPNTDPQRNDVAMVIGACLWIPRQLWYELGSFPEWFESIAEDMLICCNARLRGYTVQVVKDSFYRHRQGISFGGNRINAHRLSTTFRRRRLSERNKTFVMVLCSPLSMLMVILPVHLLLLTLEGVMLSLIKRDVRIWNEIYAGAFIAVVHQRKNLWQQRQYNMEKQAATSFLYCNNFTILPRKLLMLFRYGWPSLR